MSDAQTPADDPKLLKKEQLQKFFDTVHKGACPSCGERKWQVISPPEGSAGFLIYHPAKRTPTNGLYPKQTVGPSVFGVVNLMCGVCGLIQNFSYNTIEKWVSKQPK